jgi:hypothetical protein
MDLKKESPVGHGKVIAATIYGGPHFDFGSGPKLFIDNLDDAEGTLAIFKPFFESSGLKKVIQFHPIYVSGFVIVYDVCTEAVRIEIVLCRSGTTMVLIDTFFSIMTSTVLASGVIPCIWLGSGMKPSRAIVWRNSPRNCLIGARFPFRSSFLLEKFSRTEKRAKGLNSPALLSCR